MSNHFHLCLKTPEPNLSAGIQWLESVFANRFNRFAGGVGHVFQGRFKSPLVEPGEAQVRLVNYIHLNPVRAGLVAVEELGSYAPSSFPRLGRRGCPPWLDARPWLAEIGGLKPTRAGMRRYGEYLRFREEGDPSRSAELDRELCRGWYLGTKEGKQGLSRSLLSGPLAKAAGGSAGREAGLGRYGEAGALALVDTGLGRLGKDPADLERDLKSAPWKVALAAWVRRQTGVSNRWLAQQLKMGRPDSVSRWVGAYERSAERPRCPFARRLK